MTAQNRKPVKPAARSRKHIQAEAPAMLAALSENEIIERLQQRYPQATVPVVATSTTQREPDSEAVREKKDAIIARAKMATGIDVEDVAITLAVQAAAISPAGDAHGDPEKARKIVSTAVETLADIKPEGALQSMLAAQMIGVHNAAIRFLIKATNPEQTFEGADANVLRATRLMRLFNDQLEALSKLRGKTSEQKVTVEHVHVHDGGQAIVGNVTRLPGEGEPN